MAKSNFLSDKYSPAALPEVCAPRHALLNRFHEAAQRRLVYICAPAGYGKTVSTLLWLTAAGRKTVWIGLDSYDNGISVFYRLLANGIFSTQPDNAGMEAVLKNPAFSSSPVEHSVAMLSEFLPDKRQYALVLDDMHLITNEEILKSMPIVRGAAAPFLCSADAHPERTHPADAGNGAKRPGSYHHIGTAPLFQGGDRRILSEHGAVSLPGGIKHRLYVHRRLADGGQRLCSKRTADKRARRTGAGKLHKQTDLGGLG